MSFKDFIPVISTSITIIAGYIFISVQAKKNRRAKWIEDFRKEVSHFFVITSSINYEFTEAKAFEMLASANLMSLFLVDSNNKEHSDLLIRMLTLQNMILGNRGHQWKKEHIDKFVKESGEILTMVRAVLQQELRKI